jgi:hypothetical protein
LGSPGAPVAPGAGEQAGADPLGLVGVVGGLGQVEALAGQRIDAGVDLDRYAFPRRSM